MNLLDTVAELLSPAYAVDDYKVTNVEQSVYLKDKGTSFAHLLVSPTGLCELVVDGYDFTELEYEENQQKILVGNFVEIATRVHEGEGKRSTAHRLLGLIKGRKSTLTLKLKERQFVGRKLDH